MKLKTVTLSFLLFYALTTFAGEGGNPSKSNFKPLEAQLTDQLYTPDGVGYSKDVVVNLTFRVANDFRIKVVEMDGATGYLESHVEYLLNKGTFYVNKHEVGRSYDVVLRFRQ